MSLQSFQECPEVFRHFSELLRVLEKLGNFVLFLVSSRTLQKTLVFFFSSNDFSEVLVFCALRRTFETFEEFS